MRRKTSYIKLKRRDHKLIFVLEGRNKLTVNLKNGCDVANLLAGRFFDGNGDAKFKIIPNEIPIDIDALLPIGYKRTGTKL